MRAFLILFTAGSLLSGCKSAQSPDPQSPPPQRRSAQPESQPPKQPEAIPLVTPETGLVGTVQAVNSAYRFAILDFLLSQLPADEQTLSVYRNGKKVGEVKVSGPVRGKLVTADITAGEVRTGDEVRPQ